MATIKKRQLNPQLEELRKDIPKPLDINEIVKKLITTPKIHAAFLYYQEGYVLLQTLCRWLSGTKTTNYYSGWEDFGIKLGLDPILINNIKYNLSHQDPTTYVFLAYVQKDNATIEEVLYALEEIKRQDILLKIKDLVKNFCDEVLINYNTDESKSIIKPKILPSCPFIFKNFNTLEEKSSEPKIVTERIQKSVPFINEPRLKQRHYAKTILLTYSSDADDIVQKCLVHLRKPRNNLQLGIVILNEHRYELNINPEQFIFECFAQVDYVFPIITTEYLKHITNSETNNNSALENVDHKYVKYVYTLMNTHYLKNGCRNTKVRCLIPDDIIKIVLQHPVMNHSLFQVWVRTKEINVLVENILKSNI